MNILLVRFSKLSLCALAAVVVSACCDEEPDEQPEKFDPIAVNQQFSVMENSPHNTVVGTVAVTTDNLDFSIMNGDPEHAFAIDEKTGVISISDSSKVDFEETSSFTLTIEASKDGRSSSKNVNINVQDMTPTSIELVSHYKFEANLNDAVSGYHGSIYTGTAAFVNKNGDNSKAMSFNGTTSVLIPTLFDYENRTISIWAKVTGTNAEQVIYGCDNANVKYGNTILQPYIQNSQMNLLFILSSHRTFQPISYDTWYHAAFVVEGKKFAVFFNGQKIGGKTFPDYINSTSPALSGTTLGSSRVGNDRHFTGQSDDLRVYDRALTEREVELLYYEEPK